MNIFEAEKIKNDIVNRYLSRTNQSKTKDIIAKKFLPGGDTRNATYYQPYPSYMVKGEGCYLFDCDGNKYIDLCNNFTSLIHGHSFLPIVEAAQKQLEKGVVLCSAAEIQYQHAEIMCGRVSSLDKVRYCNSGTEATMFAIRAARAYMQKDKILKMDGGYHGTHDSVQINVIPDVTAEGRPNTFLTKGVSKSVKDDVFIVPFNNLEITESVLKEFHKEIAAIIMEPSLGPIGMIPPEKDYLKGMRQLADEYGVLLIFDEVMMFRLALGGAQSYFGVEPDITAFGKLIGGGFPIGAFGGRKEIMERFDPSYPKTKMILHSGTFNGNDITMAAGLVALQYYHEQEINKVNELGERLRQGINEAFETAGIKGQASGVGSLLQIHWRDGVINNAKEFAIGVISSKELIDLFHLEMLNRGIFIAHRGMFVISTPMTKSIVDQVIDECRTTFALLKPYIRETQPDLIS